MTRLAASSMLPLGPVSLERYAEARETVRTVRRGIEHELARHQREVLLAMAIQDMSAGDLAERLHSTSGALYKTLHDARRKLRADPQYA